MTTRDLIRARQAEGPKTDIAERLETAAGRVLYEPTQELLEAAAQEIKQLRARLSRAEHDG